MGMTAIAIGLFEWGVVDDIERSDLANLSSVSFWSFIAHVSQAYELDEWYNLSVYIHQLDWWRLYRVFE